MILKKKYYPEDFSHISIGNQDLRLLFNYASYFHIQITKREVYATFIFTHNNEWKVDYPLHILYEAKKKQIEDLNQQIASA